MPAIWFRAYAVMLLRLEAEDELRLARAAGAGSGWMKPEDQRSYTRQLQRIAQGGQQRKPQYASPREAAESMGIAIVRG